MTATYDAMSEQEKREVHLYGCTEAQMREAVESYQPNRSPVKVAQDILDWCDDELEAMVEGNRGEFDRMVMEDVRQGINRAEWITTNYVVAATTELG